MGTRAIIARAVLENDQYTGKFVGVYHHWDGYPTGLGAELVDLINGRFKGSIASMLNYVIDKHSGGWSSLMMMNAKRTKRAPECFCHPKRKGRVAEAMGQFCDQDTDCCAEWTYVFDVKNRIMYVTDVYAKVTITLPLNIGEEINWDHVACGKNFERCKHVAEYHEKDMPEASRRLGMAKWLGTEPLEISDAIAVIIRGKRYDMTGSGHSYRHRPTCTVVNSNAWISSLVDEDGRRHELPTSIIDGPNHLPYPGVEYIMPPTKMKQANVLTAETVDMVMPSESKENVKYQVVLGTTASCTCPDFKFRKRICKHIQTATWLAQALYGR